MFTYNFTLQRKECKARFWDLSKAAFITEFLNTIVLFAIYIVTLATV